MYLYRTQAPPLNNVRNIKQQKIMKDTYFLRGKAGRIFAHGAIVTSFLKKGNKK